MKFRYQRLMLRTALVYLLLGIALGLLLHLRYAFPALALPGLRTVHVHLILAGALMQIVMGVALWMFPRKRKAPHYTSEAEGLSLYILYNAGVIVRTACEPFGASGGPLYWGAFTGMVLQVAGFAFFVYLIRKRIRMPGDKTKD